MGNSQSEDAAPLFRDREAARYSGISAQPILEQEQVNNSSSGTSEESMSSKAPSKLINFVLFVIILVCVAFTQVIAWFATPDETLHDFRGVLNGLAGYTMVVQWVVYIHAAGFFGNERTEKYYDLTGSFTYLSTLAFSLLFFINAAIEARQIVLSAFVAVWSARLGWFLFSRIHNSGGIDSRFTEVKASRPRFLLAWTMQGMWVFITMFGVLILNQYSVFVPLGVYDYVGFPLWGIGFLFEVVADFQKSAFRKNPENRDKFIHNGLWSISRHPNYFGEILLWIGISISAFGGLSAVPRAAFVFLSPAFVSLLLIFVSGIPLLEKKADQKFGDNEDYLRYKRRTPVLVPILGHIWLFFYSFCRKS